MIDTRNLPKFPGPPHPTMLLPFLPPSLSSQLTDQPLNGH